MKMAKALNIEKEQNKILILEKFNENWNKAETKLEQSWHQASTSWNKVGRRRNKPEEGGTSLTPDPK